jgi:hypothetical protein
MAIAILIHFWVSKTAVNGKLSCTIATFDMVSNRKERNQCGMILRLRVLMLVNLILISSLDVLDKLKLP